MRTRNRGDGGNPPTAFVSLKLYRICRSHRTPRHGSRSRWIFDRRPGPRSWPAWIGTVVWHRAASDDHVRSPLADLPAAELSPQDPEELLSGHDAILVRNCPVRWTITSLGQPPIHRRVCRRPPTLEPASGVRREGGSVGAPAESAERVGGLGGSEPLHPASGSSLKTTRRRSVGCAPQQLRTFQSRDALGTLSVSEATRRPRGPGPCLKHGRVHSHVLDPNGPRSPFPLHGFPVHRFLPRHSDAGLQRCVTLRIHFVILLSNPAVKLGVQTAGAAARSAVQG